MKINDRHRCGKMIKHDEQIDVKIMIEYSSDLFAKI